MEHENCTTLSNSDRYLQGSIFFHRLANIEKGVPTYNHISEPSGHSDDTEEVLFDFQLLHSSPCYYYFVLLRVIDALTAEYPTIQWNFLFLGLRI